MQQPLFHVVLEGRRLGPYDRRTIVGMRIRKTLSSEHVLVDSAGAQLTVGDLIGRRPREAFQPRSSHSTIVQASYPAALRSVHGEGLAVPPFKGELELRVQSEVLRIAGRCRRGWAWKDERIKLPLKDIVHAQAIGSEVDLGVRTESGALLQRMRLELFAPDSAAELLQWFPAASPWPAAAQPATQVPPLRQWLWAWAAAGGATIVVLVLVGLVIARRLY